MVSQQDAPVAMLCDVQEPDEAMQSIVGLESLMSFTRATEGDEFCRMPKGDPMPMATTTVMDLNYFYPTILPMKHKPQQARTIPEPSENVGSQPSAHVDEKDNVLVWTHRVTKGGCTSEQVNDIFKKLEKEVKFDNDMVEVSFRKANNDVSEVYSHFALQPGQRSMDWSQDFLLISRRNPQRASNGISTKGT